MFCYISLDFCPFLWYNILEEIVPNPTKEDPKMKRKRTHTILATITLISVILTSACTAGSANSTTSSAPETAVTTTAPAVTGTVMDRIDEPKAETTTAQTTTAVTTKPQETKSAETTTTTTKAVTTAKPKPATTTTAATTKPAPEWTETKASGTKYVNTDCYSRKKAVLGAETVKLYSVNDKVTVIAKTDTGYFKLSDGSFIHSDYLSDNKVAQTTITTKKAETPKPSQTTTKKQEGKPKSIYEYPFDLEAIKKVIVDDAVNNYGLINDDDPSWVPEGSSWFTPLVICCDLHPNVVKRDVESFAKDNIKGFMKKGDYFKIYIRDISEDMDIRDENGKLTKAYAIYFLRSQAGDDGNPEYP